MRSHNTYAHVGKTAVASPFCFVKIKNNIPNPLLFVLLHIYYCNMCVGESEMIVMGVGGGGLFASSPTRRWNRVHIEVEAKRREKGVNIGEDLQWKQVFSLHTFFDLSLFCHPICVIAASERGHLRSICSIKTKNLTAFVDVLIKTTIKIVVFIASFINTLADECRNIFLLIGKRRAHRPFCVNLRA